MKKYCIYIFKKGSKKGTSCKEVCHLDLPFCKKHSILDTNNTNNIRKVTTTNQSDSQDVRNENEVRTIPKIKAVRKNVPEDNVNGVPVIRINKMTNKRFVEDSLKERIMNLRTTDENKSIIFKHYNNLKRTDPSSTEYYKNQIYIDAALNYPWDKQYNIHDKIHNQSIADFIHSIKTGLDNEIHGMDSVKNEILNVVCKFITNPYSNRNNIALYGPAGVGKSKFIKILSNILGIPIKTISLGGVKDSSFFLGHGYVYVESGPGKIIQNIIDSKISNPIMYFDELDKVSETDNGKDIYSFLCYLTDPTQNKHFSDHYFYGMHFDLSKVFYVFTFNDITKIDKILLDRLNIIKVASPSDDDIIKILETHCIPEIVTNIGIQQKVVFEKENIQYIVQYCKDSIDKSISSGIREYYRIIEKILLELNKEILLNINKYATTVSININYNFFMSLFDKVKDQLNSYVQNNILFSHMYI
jgi:ATP-dependent Lon protease